MVKVGLDLGYGFVKAVSSDGKTIKIPTWLAVATPGLYSDFETYVLNGVKYWIGEAALYGEKIELNTAEDLVRFYPIFRDYVLRRLNIPQAQVITGLSPIDYFSKSNLKAMIENDVVLWQGLGVLIDQSDKLTDVDTVAVIDIGFNTVDYVIVRRVDGKWKKVKVNSIPHLGLMRAINIFKDLLPNSDYDFLKTATKQSLVLAFENKKISHYGQVVDITGYVNNAVSQYSGLLDTILESEIDMGSVEKVVVAGGGSYYYKPSSHKNVLIPEEPEFSNARGYLKWIGGM